MTDGAFNTVSFEFGSVVAASDEIVLVRGVTPTHCGGSNERAWKRADVFFCDWNKAMRLGHEFATDANVAKALCETAINGAKQKRDKALADIQGRAQQN
jgi:hypothetical protein